MDSLIRDLDDATAIRVLQTFASARARQADYVTRWTPEVRQVLLQALDAADIPPVPVSEADLAREILRGLTADPELREPLLALIHHPPPQRFLDPGTMALGVAALIALQTHVKFERSKAGKWSLKIEKKSLPSGCSRSLRDSPQETSRHRVGSGTDVEDARDGRREPKQTPGCQRSAPLFCIRWLSATRHRWES